MIKCKECGQVFYEDESRVIRQEVGVWLGFPCYEELDTCPYCHSDDLWYDYDPPPENAERCVICGDIIPEGRQVCPNCEDEEFEDDEVL